MEWEADELGGVHPVGGELAGPILFDSLERRFWIELWRTPVLDAVEEQRIELRWYGPVQAMATAGLRRVPMFNLVLGATEPGAVEYGHLEQALDWMESLRVDFRVPLTPGRAESDAAQDLLSLRGYSCEDGLLRFALCGEPVSLPEPAGIEVIEIEEFTEGFSDFPGEGFGLDLTAWSFFDCLPGREGWRCYVALDRRGYPVASAATMLHLEVAQLAFAATSEAARGQGAHTALLQRRIRDTLGPRRPTLFAEIEEPLDRLGKPSPAARNLARAGFERIEVRPVWRPPPPPDDDGWDDDDDVDDPDGGGSAFDFELAEKRLRPRELSLG